MSEIIKQSTLNLFLDNIVDNISAADLRIFVDNVWDDKENTIRKIGNLPAILDEINVEAGDIIICTSGSDEGMYIADIKHPEVANLTKITSQTSEIPGGSDGQILSTQNGELIWIDRDYTFQVVGTLPIADIMLLRPNAGITYIAEDNSNTALVPGVVGDGYTWNGLEWLNIGQMRGPIGNAGSTGQSGVDGDGFRLKGEAPSATILLKGSPTTIIGDVWRSTDIGLDSQGIAIAEGDALACSNPTLKYWYKIGLFEGPTGEIGLTGDAGVDGIDGAQGLTGDRGPIGVDGAQGPTGASGTPGTTGTDGADGADGAIGAAGTDGAIGAAGAVGAKGDIGETGLTGADGTDASVTFASQAEVDAGTAGDVSISPVTFENSAQLSSKEDNIVVGLADQVFVTDNTGTTKGWVNPEIIAPVRTVAGKTGDVLVTKNDIGLNNVDDTADLDKPISNLTQAGLDTKSDTDHVHTILNDTLYEPKDAMIQTHITSTDNPHQVDKIDIGLSNIPNDLPIDWSISSAVQAELDLTYVQGGVATWNDMSAVTDMNTIYEVNGTYINGATDPMEGTTIIQEGAISGHAVQHYFAKTGENWSRTYNDDTSGWTSWEVQANISDIVSIQDGTTKSTGFTPTVDEDFATKLYVDTVTISGGLTNDDVASMYHQAAIDSNGDFYKYVAVDKAKLISVEEGSTADQTDQEIVTAYQNIADYFNNDDRNKLDGIESGATTDMTNTEIATSYESYSNVERFTTDFRTIVQNTSGINTGDQSVLDIEALLYDGTRDNNKFTDDDEAKLDLLASENLYKGTFLNATLLDDEWGASGASGLPADGSYAYINNNVDDDEVFSMRMWDVDDQLWREVLADAAISMSADQIEALLYDGTRDNSKYLDADRIKLVAITTSTATETNNRTGTGYVVSGDLNAPLTTIETSITDLDASKEDDLGTPASDNYMLISTAAGVRSWSEQTISTATSQTDYTTFIPVATGPDTTIYVDSADSEIKYRVSAGTIINITGARDSYGLIQTDLSIGTLAGGADASAKPTYNSNELAYNSDTDALKYITTALQYDGASATTITSLLKYSSNSDYGSMGDTELVSKGNLNNIEINITTNADNITTNSNNITTITNAALKYVDTGLMVMSTIEDFTTTLVDTWEQLILTTASTTIDASNGHFSFAAGIMTITSPGIYKISTHGSAQWSNTETLEFTIYKEGVVVNAAGNPIFEGKGATSVYIATSNFIEITQADLDGSAGDIEMTLYMKTPTAQTIAVDFAEFSIEKTAY